MPVGLFVPVYLSFVDHRKTVRTAALLKADRYKVMGHLLTLWCWAMVNAEETGLIRNATPEEIALAARWDGRPEDWETALHAAELIDKTDDGYVIHDWHETGGKVLREMRLDRERWRDRKDKRRTDEPSPRPPAQGGQPEVRLGVHSTGGSGGASAEARGKTRRDFKDSSVGGTDLPVEYPKWFSDWWDLYTTLAGRGRAKRETLKLATRLPLEVRNELYVRTRDHDLRRHAAAAAGVFVAPWPDPERYIKHRGWEDVFVLPPGAGAAAGEPAEDSANVRLIREERAHGKDPLWREYERLVLDHRIPVDWDTWRQAQAVAS